MVINGALSLETVNCFQLLIGLFLFHDPNIDILKKKTETLSPSEMLDNIIMVVHHHCQRLANNQGEPDERVSEPWSKHLFEEKTASLM